MKFLESINLFPGTGVGVAQSIRAYADCVAVLLVLFVYPERSISNPLMIMIEKAAGSSE